MRREFNELDFEPSFGALMALRAMAETGKTFPWFQAEAGSIFLVLSSIHSCNDTVNQVLAELTEFFMIQIPADRTYPYPHKEKTKFIALRKSGTIRLARSLVELISQNDLRSQEEVITDEVITGEATETKKISVRAEWWQNFILLLSKTDPTLPDFSGKSLTKDDFLVTMD